MSSSSLKSPRLRSPRASPLSLSSPRGSPRHGSGGGNGGNGACCTESSALYMTGRCVRYSIFALLPLALILSVTNIRPWDAITTVNRVTFFEDRPSLQISSYSESTDDDDDDETIDNNNKNLKEQRSSQSDDTTTMKPPAAPNSITTKDNTSVGGGGGDLNSYNAFLHPIIKDYRSFVSSSSLSSLSLPPNDDDKKSPSSSLKSKQQIINPSVPSKVQVHFVVDVSTNNIGPQKSKYNNVGPQSKFILDGLERSNYIEVVSITFIGRHTIKTVQLHKVNNKQLLVYVIDWGSMNRDCHVLDRFLQQQQELLQKEYQQQQQQQDDQLVLIDYSGSTRQTTCPNLSSIPQERVRLVKRNIVQNRYYDMSERRIHQGEVALNEGLQISNGPVLHSPMVVREVFVRGVQNVTSQPPYRKIRPIDVAMFWDVGYNTHYGFLRRDVSTVIQSMNGTLAGSQKSIQVVVQLVGNNDDGMERGNVQVEYVRQLISTKIVICAGRDEWEDQYRLMESLASGALVFTDPMITLPKGLHNKTNIIIYEDIPNLQQLIQYYLNPKNEAKRREIAKNGWILAMSQHRSWHRMEELFFGQPLTHVDQPYDPAPSKARHPSIDFITSEAF